MRATALREHYQIRLSGYMDLQYVEDVAETFVRCLLSPLEGAFAFNLQGSVVSMDELVPTSRPHWPGAADLITCAGPQVPVAYRLDDSQLAARSKVFLGQAGPGYFSNDRTL